MTGITQFPGPTGPNRPLEGLGREDIAVLARFPGLDDFVDKRRAAGAMPQDIVGFLNWHYDVKCFTEKWVQSIIRRLDGNKGLAAPLRRE